MKAIANWISLFLSHRTSTGEYFNPNNNGDDPSQVEKKEQNPGGEMEVDFDDNYDDSGDYEPDTAGEHYGISGEKYGWYNGFSDDVIDDAFDGDPGATWNVD